MNENSVNQSILELLAMTIFADKKIYADEIQAFTHSVIKLQNEGMLSTNMTEVKIILWYETHKDALMEYLTTSKFEIWLSGKIFDLDRVPDKFKVLEAIEYISFSDGEEHISEKALRMLASKKLDENFIPQQKNP